MLHHQDLDHSDEDVQEIQLKGDGLVDGITAHDTSLGETSVVQNLLDVVESETTEDGETTIQPDALGKGNGSDGGGGEDERSEAGDGDNGSTGEERATDVEVLLLLSSGTDERQTAHHGNGVETSAGDERTGDEGEQRGDEGGLGDVEGGPHGVLGDIAVKGLVFLQNHGFHELDLLVRADGSSGNHGTKAERKTTNADNPRVGHHNSVNEASLNHLPSRQTNDTNSKTRMQKGVVQVFPLIDGHAAILPRLPVEHHVDRNERTAKDGAADEHPSHIALAARDRLLARRLLTIRALASAAAHECISSRRRRRRDSRCEEPGARLGRGGSAVQASRSRSERRLCELREPLREARGTLADREGK